MRLLGLGTGAQRQPQLPGGGRACTRPATSGTRAPRVTGWPTAAATLAIGIGAAHGAGNGIIACVPCGLQPNPLTPCAQDTSGTWAYPNSVENDGDNYYIDLEVAPVSVAKVNSGAFLAFFP